MSEIDENADPRCRSASAPSTPTSQSPKILAEGRSGKGHRVNFPEDNQIVTGYFEAPNPWSYTVTQALETLVDSYKLACEKQGIKPINKILKQLESFKSNDFRTQDLSLRGEKLDYRECEAIEEIFKRIQFRLIDLESCDLDGEGASSLFDMMEYYESCSHLSISNIKSIGMLGWQALCRMLKKTSCLQYLDLSNTGLNEQILLILGRAIRLGSQLTTLHLENAGLYGRRLAILVAALKLNTNLRKLYLGDNKIASAEGVQIGNLLRSNSSLDLLDLRRNYLQDLGLDHICEGLCHQSKTDDGLKVLNICENQITCRGIHCLSETLPSCTTLITLNLSCNYLGNDGVSILKAGLLSNKSLKCLKLRNCQITDEGASTIAEFISSSNKIVQIDLSENDIQYNGLNALALALKHNTSLIDLKVADCLSDKENAINVILDPTDPLSEIIEYCERNRKALSCEDNDVIYFDDMDFLDEVNEKFSSLNHQKLHAISEPMECSNSNHNDELTPDLLMNSSKIAHHQNIKPDILFDQDSLSHKQLMRTTSLGTWENQVGKDAKRSGRFSVSPVQLSIDTDLMKPEEIGINIIKDESGNSSDSVNTNSDGNESENTDKLTELPKNIPKKLSLTIPEPSGLPYRRMSTPSLSLTAPSKPKSNTKTKICRNLDSLDLKSSIPVSPTFFARFEFPDPLLLRLPPEVEEVIQLIQLPEDNMKNSN